MLLHILIIVFTLYQYNMLNESCVAEEGDLAYSLMLGAPFFPDQLIDNQDMQTDLLDQGLFVCYLAERMKSQQMTLLYKEMNYIYRSQSMFFNCDGMVYKVVQADI